jgi:hypothetical protein
MKSAGIFVAMFFCGFVVFGQCQCAFKAENVKQRHDQYSQSSKDNIDKSKKDMDKQSEDFDKKKYVAEVKNSKANTQRRKTTMRYY